MNRAQIESIIAQVESKLDTKRQELGAAVVNADVSLSDAKVIHEQAVILADRRRVLRSLLLVDSAEDYLKQSTIEALFLS
ncbi:hypothetical protein EniLVp02_0223 [Vibrio phage EniLVp02]